MSERVKWTRDGDWQFVTVNGFVCTVSKFGPWGWTAEVDVARGWTPMEREYATEAAAKRAAVALARRLAKGGA